MNGFEEYNLLANIFIFKIINVMLYFCILTVFSFFEIQGIPLHRLFIWDESERLMI